MDRRGNPMVVLARYLEREDEDSFKTWVIELAMLHKWKVAHFRGAWSLDGKHFRTPVEADAEGFPDLVLARGPATIYAELKTKKGKLTDAQKEWLAALAENPGNKCFVWRPADRNEIEEVLS